VVNFIARKVLIYFSLHTSPPFSSLGELSPIDRLMPISMRHNRTVVSRCDTCRVQGLSLCVEHMVDILLSIRDEGRLCLCLTHLLSLSLSPPLSLSLFASLSLSLSLCVKQMCGADEVVLFERATFHTLTLSLSRSLSLSPSPPLSLTHTLSLRHTLTHTLYTDVRGRRGGAVRASNISGHLTRHAQAI
jgi:hypothetical protein